MAGKRAGAPRQYRKRAANGELSGRCQLSAAERLEKVTGGDPSWAACELVDLVKRGKRRDLERAEIRAYKRPAGLSVGFVWVWVRNNESKKITDKIERWRKEQNASLVHTQSLADTVDTHLEAFRAGFRDGVEEVQTARRAREN